MKKIYHIYRKNQDNSMFLYAFSDKKHLAKSFISERKKSMFIIIKKELKDDEFTIFKRDHSQLLLGRHGFETIVNSKKEIVYLTTPNFEEVDVYVKEDHMYEELGKYIDRLSFSCNTKILKALDMLEYFSICKFCGGDDYYYEHFLSGTHYNPRIKLDHLGMFIYLYGYTMNKDI